MVDQVTVKLPNSATLGELINDGNSPEQANEILHKRVFGANYKRDEDGKPVEQGLGGPLQQTSQHFQALERERERKAMAGGRANSDVISAAVAAGVQAGLAAARDADKL